MLKKTALTKGRYYSVLFLSHSKQNDNTPPLLTQTLTITSFFLFEEADDSNHK
jgi:hypothetical protein